MGLATCSPIGEEVEIKGIILSESEPIVPVNWEEYMLWLKLSTGEWHEWNGSAWVVVFAPLMAVPPEIGDVNFIGAVKADGLAGISGEFEGAFKKVKIQDGLIVEFELE